MLTVTAVLQRVKSASVTVDGKLISSIGKGTLVFVGVGKEDTPKEVEKMAGKVLTMQLWDDDQGGKVSMPRAIPADMSVLIPWAVEEERQRHRRRGFVRYVTLLRASVGGAADTSCSLTIHPTRIHKEGEKAQLSQVCTGTAGSGFVFFLFPKDSRALRKRQSQGRHLPGHDGCCTSE